MMERLVAPGIALAALLILSTTLQPSKAVMGPDGNCKARNTQQVCLATLKSFERASSGWILYLEGKDPYTVSSHYLPKNQVGKTLEFQMVETPIGWNVKDWVTKY